MLDVEQMVCKESFHEGIHSMKNITHLRSSLPCRVAVLLLASAIGIPAWAQQTQSANAQSTPPSAEQQPSPPASTFVPPPKEGFWGHLNPLARKKWVRRQTDPINDRLNELDQINSKTAKTIDDVDQRAQAGIQKAQSSADAANQAASAAGQQAQTADSTAKNAAGQVDQLHSTVNGLDQYHQVTQVSIEFRHGQPVLTDEAKQQLDSLAASVTGHIGFILEMEAHSPYRGSAGIQRSQRLAEAVERYLYEQHQIPVYRMHAVALGNAVPAATAGDEDAGRVRTSSVQVRLMENSLAAQDSASPQNAASLNGAERP